MAFCMVLLTDWLICLRSRLNLRLKSRWRRNFFRSIFIHISWFFMLLLSINRRLISQSTL